MKQIVQFLSSGQTKLLDFPSPSIKDGEILIKSTYSLVSLGTEKMIVKGTKESLFSRAKKNPEKIAKLIQRIKENGIVQTFNSVSNQIDQIFPLGYCNSGIVIGIGKNINDINIGDRVCSNGSHSEIVSVPRNLVCKIPDGVTDQESAFTVVGSIALQGVRLCNPSLGETIVVLGLGLVGMITIQILKANGCKVIGIDVDNKKCDLAKTFGAKVYNSQEITDIGKFIYDETKFGVDGVIITASNFSNKIIKDSAKMSRKRGRIILVGVVGLNIDRNDFYQKELSFQVSCSYGPGRYDKEYESGIIDYPVPYVRWTENRNFEAFLELIEDSKLNLNKLISQEINLEDVELFYNNIEGSDSIATLIKYPIEHDKRKLIQINSRIKYNATKGVLGFIGSGGFTENTIIPSLVKSHANLKGIASETGFTAGKLARKFRISYCTSDYTKIIEDSDIDLVVISTQHDSHSKFVCEALSSGKNVFVEKPLAINEIQLEEVIRTYTLFRGEKQLVVGFNRRFSPHMQAIKKSLGNIKNPISIIATMNAGFVPKDSWIQNIERSGGRIIGEACHLFDLCVFLTGSLITRVSMNALGNSPRPDCDIATISLHFDNGSIACINYFSNGANSYNKERIEVYSDGRTWINENFQLTTAYNVPGFKKLKTNLDKGHTNQFHQLIKNIKEGSGPIIPSEEIFNVTRATFIALRSMEEKKWLSL